MSPDRKNVLAFSSTVNNSVVEVIGTAGETQMGGVLLPGPTTSMVALDTGFGYAAVPSAPLAADPAGDLKPEEFHTPGRKTIAEVAEFTGLPETSQMKSLVLVADGKPVLVMLRGDHQLSEAKFGSVSGDPEFRQAHPHAVPQCRAEPPTAATAAIPAHKGASLWQQGNT